VNAATAPELLRFPADLLSVRALGPWLAEVLERQCGDDAVAKAPMIELAIHELCINIVEHAYGATEGHVDVTFSATPATLTFVICDVGSPFDGELTGRSDDDEPTIRGYGMHIITQLASQLHYERVDDTNRWTVEFSRSDDDPEPPTTLTPATHEPNQRKTQP
jgi:serine/threonine-protein kinase RsbW